jgi:hypothetical protein
MSEELTLNCQMCLYIHDELEAEEVILPLAIQCAVD